MFHDHPRIAPYNFRLNDPADRTVLADLLEEADRLEEVALLRSPWSLLRWWQDRTAPGEPWTVTASDHEFMVRAMNLARTASATSGLLYHEQQAYAALRFLETYEDDTLRCLPCGPAVFTPGWRTWVCPRAVRLPGQDRHELVLFVALILVSGNHAGVQVPRLFPRTTVSRLLLPCPRDNQFSTLRSYAIEPPYPGVEAHLDFCRQRAIAEWLSQYAS